MIRPVDMDAFRYLGQPALLARRFSVRVARRPARKQGCGPGAGGAENAVTVWTVAPELPGSPVAAALWRAYCTEVSDRWYLLHEGRRTDPAELEREIAAESGADLVPPHGRLLIARYGGEAAGSAGIRLLGGATAEPTRVFLYRGMRGRGGAVLLVRAAEEVARTSGAIRLILDTRGDLVEARALYARLGFTETEPHHDEPTAEHWFARQLGRADGRVG
ncbi:GNAT family N-acetyltransferase [Streptomyces sp. NEAU-W12]|uniref:GNAT family N-acetyltransferase n=1 Tax=Streptomyces sp. NEAU-W12 TaxID=2994668 RepID=UPI00224AADE5|nr:GNAT family N-acetyltransferase [Streptomyces sp. NEAU-W12]MCX2922980.1 GNAT family N-acetyltransferase [Streptomyces sp. NEAU-W12]